MKPRLIIVEGLPGTGKSTTAAIIAEELRKKGRQVICVDEGAENHPADYADYDFPDFETAREKILNKWNAFAAGAAEDTVYVFNCIFLQNPMCEAMMHFGLDEAACGTYIAEIADVIRPLHPVIVYLSNPDVRGTVDRVLDERGADWLNAVIGYHVDQGYGKANGLHGYEGYIACLEERKKRELHILNTLGLTAYTVEQNITPVELEQLFLSVGWSAPGREQLSAAIENSTKAFVVRKDGRAIAALHLLGDMGMHWFLKEFIVMPEYQGQMIGTLLYRFAEQFIRTTMKPGWKVCIDLRASQGREAFYENCGFSRLPDGHLGCGMEKLLAN